MLRGKPGNRKTKTVNIDIPASIDEVADALGLSHSTVRKWITGENVQTPLPAYRLGKLYRIYWDDLDTWIKSSQVGKNY